MAVQPRNANRVGIYRHAVFGSKFLHQFHPTEIQPKSHIYFLKISITHILRSKGETGENNLLIFLFNPILLFQHAIDVESVKETFSSPF